MQKNSDQKGKNPTKRRALVIGAGAVVVILLALALTNMVRPERSVAAFCKVHAEENARLANAPGESYAVAVFDHKSSNPGDFTKAFNRLERVAPDEIRPDVKTLQQVFETIEDSPSQALSASLSGISAEAGVEEWASSHCN